MLSWFILLTSPIWCFPVTWVLYVFAMSLRKYYKRIGGFGALPFTHRACHFLLGGPFLVAGLLLDYYVNFVVMWPLLWQAPRFYAVRVLGVTLFAPRLTSARLSDHYGKPGYRGKVCTGICDIFLHPFDEAHCIRKGD